MDESAVFQVVDDSAQHRGHKGHNPQVGVTHITLNIAWNAFEGLTLLERQRLANAWLDEFFKKGLHAVRYNLKTPKENISI